MIRAIPSMFTGLCVTILRSANSAGIPVQGRQPCRDHEFWRD